MHTHRDNECERLGSLRELCVWICSVSVHTHPWREQTNVASTPVSSSGERSEGLKEQSNTFIDNFYFTTIILNTNAYAQA